MTKSEQLFARAQALMPGGVNSPVRAFRAVGGSPRFIRSARGCRLTDVDGREYIDYIGAWGPAILGHAHPSVIEAIELTIQNGTSFGTPSPLEVELAREIVVRVPSIEKVRMVNSGTEAVMSAIRLARAATGREKVLKFDGCYHGHADSMLVKAGSGVATLGLPDSPGVTSGAAATTLTALYNDLEAVRRVFESAGTQIAAIIVEPIAGNMGVVPPTDGFLAGLRDISTAHGALLIFDEVMTGFRVARGGAQERLGIRPDLTTLGKIIGGGLPVGAYGGRADLMDMIAPTGPVYQAGTLSGNPVAMAAGLATLQLLDAKAYGRLEELSARLEAGLRRTLEETGERGVVQRIGSMLTLFLGVPAVRNFADAAAADHRRFAAFFHAMLDRGVHLPPSGYEAWFVSLAHDDESIDRTIEAARESLISR
ncbi:MAG TPA: glutamate-1-semialdehyde 2,1-aminomutase [Phycisphaerae bacterium]|nr:glutamate-1-semialdehyde 2,1-aminomutase [Phycisphaerae bacterium]